MCRALAHLASVTAGVGGGAAIPASFLPRNAAACVAEQRPGQSAQLQIIPSAEKDVESQAD